MDWLWAPWATVWGSPLTRLESLAFLLSVAMVIANQRQWLVAWPLSIAASALYGLFFWHGALFGEAVLQGFFILLAFWGAWQWWRGSGNGQGLPVRRMSRREWQISAPALLVGALVLGWGLDRYTSSEVPHLDAWATAGSVLGTVLLARKRLENWAVWVAVNSFSVLLFAYKGYWLTVLLYAAFVPMALWGWKVWREAL